MNWYKIAQFTPENTQNVISPIVNVQPEPIVQQIVDELKSEDPRFFVGINKLNLDMGYGQLGSVSSNNPADINLNFGKIKSEISSQLGESFNNNNPSHISALKDAIRRILIHERAHVLDAAQAQEGAKNPLSGNELFPGGEGVAETAERSYFKN